jgi:hypothetical protein
MSAPFHRCCRVLTAISLIKCFQNVRNALPFPVALSLSSYFVAAVAVDVDLYCMDLLTRYDTIHIRSIFAVDAWISAA